MTLEQLLKHKPAASFTAQELSGKAFWRLQRGEHHAAHLLFEAACARARETGETWRCHRNRAATALFDSGAIAQALPRVHEVLDDYEAHPEARDDRHWVEHATQRLHRLAYQEQPASFETRYRELTARASRIQGRSSPWIHPFQEELLGFARELGLKAIARELIEVIAARRPMPRALRRRLDELERWAKSPGSLA
ncbi:MAG: hypothetical protein H6713_29865 [Myxococcales bacterium]|nr:hypothetical protein [Myxococcales bacterium]MCB9754170.1 hypothetical protein [Myxococcales bacterium]